MESLYFKHEKMSDEFDKMHIKGLPFDAVIHKFTAPDIGGPHDHPFGFNAHVLKGGYVEKVYEINEGLVTSKIQYWPEGSSRFVPANLIHELVDLPDGDCYTIITPRRKEKEIYFYKFEDNQILRRHIDEEEYKPYKS